MRFSPYVHNPTQDLGKQQNSGAYAEKCWNLRLLLLFCHLLINFPGQNCGKKPQVIQLLISWFPALRTILN